MACQREAEVRSPQRASRSTRHSFRDAVQERTEALRFDLSEAIRVEVEQEERLLAALLAGIEERRAASVPS